MSMSIKLLFNLEILQENTAVSPKKTYSEILFWYGMLWENWRIIYSPRYHIPVTIVK